MYLQTKPILKNQFVKMLNFSKKKYQEKWENAYLTVKSTRAYVALSGPQTPQLTE